MSQQQIIYEEDIETATQTAISILGKQGRMLEFGATVEHNTILETKEHGKIWYGDIDVSEDNAKLEQLSLALGVTLYIRPDDIESFRPVSTNTMLMHSYAVYSAGRPIKHRYLMV